MRHYPISDAKKNIRATLGTLEEWYVLFGNCYACDHIGFIDRWHLQSKLGKDCRVKALEPRLRCTMCGNRMHNGFCIAKQKR